MTHEVDCEYFNEKYVNEPYCYGADCTEAEFEKIFEDENDWCPWYSADSAASSLGLSSVLVSVAMSGLWWLYNL